MCNGYVKNTVPVPLLYKYYTLLRLCLAANIDNGVINITTLCTSVMFEPFNLCSCIDPPLPPSIYIYLIDLTHFINSVTSINQSLLYYQGRFYRLLQRWLKSCLSYGKIPLLHISICNRILDFIPIHYLYNKLYSTLLCNNPCLYIH